MAVVVAVAADLHTLHYLYWLTLEFLGAVETAYILGHHRFVVAVVVVVPDLN